MRAKKMRRLTLSESMTLLLLAGEIEERVDADLAGLVRRAVAGDDTALLPAVDRLKEIGRSACSSRPKALVLTK